VGLNPIRELAANTTIIFFIHGFLTLFIVFHDTSISAREDLKERSAKVDRIHIFSLRFTINNLKQGTKSVLEYFIKLRSLWDELNFDRPIPNCTCIHPCRFDSTRVAKNYKTLARILC